MNFDNYGGLHAGFYLAACELRDFAAGQRTMRYGDEYARYRCSPFAYRSTRSAAAVIAYRDGRKVTDLKAPEDLTMALRRVVRLQTVKCSPVNDHWSNQPRRCGRTAPRCFWQMSSRSRSLDTCLGLATTSAGRSGSYEASRPAGSGPGFTLVRSHSRAVTPKRCFCITQSDGFRRGGAALGPARDGRRRPAFVVVQASSRRLHAPAWRGNRGWAVYPAGVQRSADIPCRRVRKTTCACRCQESAAPGSAWTAGGAVAC